MSLLSTIESDVSKLKAIAQSVAAVWPAVKTFVIDVEADAESVLPASGAEKLAEVKARVEAVWNAGAGVVADFEAAWPALSAAISALVAFYNAKGLFTKSSTPST